MDTFEASANPFAELERLGGLEPFATRREILTQLRVSEREERHKAQLPGTQLGRFSEKEADEFRSEGWTVVAPRARTRSSKAPTCKSVEAVPSRALPTGVTSRRNMPAALPTENKFWRYLRWAALGALGAIALSKLASRR